MVLNILVWCFIVGFVVLAAYVTNDNNVTNTKVYNDLNETMLNRNENV